MKMDVKLHDWNRRRFVSQATLGVAALGVLNINSRGVQAIEPFTRSDSSQLHLGLAAYSVRDLLTNSSSGWDLFRFVDYCQELGISGAELTSYYFPKDVTNEYLIDLKQHCHRRGVLISGGAIRNDFCQSDPEKLQAGIEHTKLWIDRYALLGAPSIRIFAGNQPAGEDIHKTIQRCVRGCEEVSNYAYTKGVYLGLENHGGVTAKAEGLLEIVKQVNAKSFGVNLDSGNFRSTDDPYAELQAIAPYAVNAQVKVDMYPNGKHESTDLSRVIRILRESRYSGWVVLEYEAKEPPLERIPEIVRDLKNFIANG